MTANQFDGTVSVINPANNTVIATITVDPGSAPRGAAVSPTRAEAGDVYVADLGNSTCR